MSLRYRFPIYSITKTFTAVCLLRLESAGVLHLDDPISKWRTDLPIPPDIRLSQILQHTSGLPDYGSLRAYHDAVRTSPSIPWTARHFLEITMANGVLFTPGTSWAYSNIGYLLLRQILETAAGISFRHCVDEHIITRLELPDTFVAETINDWSSCVPGYGREIKLDGGIVDIRALYHPGWCAPGVAVSTVEDVTRFYDSLFAGELLDSQSLDRMLRLVRVPGLSPSSVTPCCGLGILADPDGPFGASFGHGGNGPGYSLSASIVPRSANGRLSIAVFCNSSMGANAKTGEEEMLRVAVEAD
jgi:D-alanyl-D-alanine carboxypeptidase